MVLVQILKRRDATSAIVAIIAALVIAQFIGAMINDLSLKISGLGSAQLVTGLSWKQQYLQPFVAMILSFLALELLVRIVLAVKALTEQSQKPSKKRK